MAISADGQTALSCGDKTLRLWDTATGTALAAFHFDREPVCCAMTPDGQTIAIADLAGELSLLATMPACQA